MDLRSTLIPLRFFLTVGHLLAVIMISYTKNNNVMVSPNPQIHMYAGPHSRIENGTVASDVTPPPLLSMHPRYTLALYLICFYNSGGPHIDITKYKNTTQFGDRFVELSGLGGTLREHGGVPCRGGLGGKQYERRHHCRLSLFCV